MTIPEIYELREYDGDCDWGSVMGYWCKGHVDPKKFAITCNQSFELADYGKPISVDMVEHGYLRKVYEDDEGEPMLDGSYLIEKTSSSKPDAIEATFVFY
jgi:hypothetical protein